MANAGVKTLLQSKELLEAMEAPLGSQAQPPVSCPLLGPGPPQALARHAAISSPGNSTPQNCYNLKRTFACTNLLQLSLASPDSSTERRLPSVPTCTRRAPRINLSPPPPWRTDHQHLACPAEEGRTWDAVSGTNHPLQDTVVLTACCVRAMKVPLYKHSVALPLGTLGFV
eukprot:XP_027324863.1 testis-specific serine kinase substrate isoform X3 [Anas platyrhynchos]